MTATLRHPDEIDEVKKSLGMNRRHTEVIMENPIRPNTFYSRIQRPSNRTEFSEENGLCSLLEELCLKDFIENPLNGKSFIIFSRREDTIGKDQLAVSHTACMIQEYQISYLNTTFYKNSLNSH